MKESYLVISMRGLDELTASNLKEKSLLATTAMLNYVTGLAEQQFGKYRQEKQGSLTDAKMNPGIMTFTFLLQ